MDNGTNQTVPAAAGGTEAMPLALSSTYRILVSDCVFQNSSGGGGSFHTLELMMPNLSCCSEV